MKSLKFFAVACAMLISMGRLQSVHAQAKKAGSGASAARPATTPAATPPANNTATRRPTPAVNPNRAGGGATTTPATGNAGLNAQNANQTRNISLYASEACFVKVNGGPEIALAGGETRVIAVKQPNNEVAIRTQTPALTWKQQFNGIQPGQTIEGRIDFYVVNAERLRALDQQRLQTENERRREQARVDSLRRIAQSQPATPSAANNNSGNTTTAPRSNPTTAASTPPSSPLPGQLWENGIQMQFVWVPAGTFKMGSNTFDDQKPVHAVDLSRGFWMGKFEVTQAQWQAVMGTNPSKSSGNDRPVENISYEEVTAFLAKLNQQEGTTKYRLPTEAEWEYAARAGANTRYTWGGELGRGRANCATCGSTWDNKETAPVGSFFPNAFGLYDVHGNVSEWVSDWYSETFYRQQEAIKNPIGPSSGESRVVRGGSYDLGADDMQVSFRGFLPPVFKASSIGFRVVYGLN